MNRTDIVDILNIMSVAYPSFKPASKEIAVNLYFDTLAEYDASEARNALKYIITTDSSGFAPSIGKIIDTIHLMRERVAGNELSEAEAYSKLRKATSGNISYDELPEDVKKAIGRNEVRDIGYSENVDWQVVESNFRRSYRQVLERKKVDARTPQVFKEAMRIAQQELNQIGVKDDNM